MKNFKILVLSAATALVASLSSCDLNTVPEDRLDNDQALQTMSDLVKLGNGSYDLFIETYHEDLIVAGDMQGDYVNAVAAFSNNFGPLHRWDYDYSDYEVLDVWNRAYKAIGQVNFVIDNSVNVTPEGNEVAEFNKILGEQYLIRAIAMYELALKFCPAYSSSTAGNTNTGIVVSTVFDPSAMPVRSTLQETYDQILADIAQAKTLMGSVAGAANSTYLTADCITALEARVYLQMGNYAQALTAANSLIGKSTYALATGDDFIKIWTEDTGSEVIFKFYASTTELPPVQFGTQFVMDQNSKDDKFLPQYIPTQTLLDMYDENDIRKDAYFLEVTDKKCTIGGNAIATPVYLMNKYPGNLKLRTVETTKNYYNSFKLFRIAEMYLIAAEAAVATNGDAATPLNTLRTARGLAALPSVTLADVKAERVRELIFEGNRISDLKRWGDVIMPRTPQTGKIEDGSTVSLIMVGDSYEKLTVTTGDYRYVWPIPSEEIYANQNLAPQQNPGWEK